MQFRIPQRLAIMLCLCGFLFATEPAAIWLDVPFVKQTKDGCGAASVAMIMQYWAARGDHVESADMDPDLILQQLYSPAARGIYASRLESYLQQHGFRTFAVHGQWDDLQHHLKNGRPLLAALRSSGGTLHYVVIAGIDAQNQLLLVNDPAQRKLLKTERAGFEKQWSGTHNWLLLAVPATNSAQ